MSHLYIICEKIVSQIKIIIIFNKKIKEISILIFVYIKNKKYMIIKLNKSKGTEEFTTVEKNLCFIF